MRPPVQELLAIRIRPSAAAATTTPKLFVRQSSGLVRNVSVTNALFFTLPRSSASA